MSELWRKLIFGFCGTVLIGVASAVVYLLMNRADDDDEFGGGTSDPSRTYGRIFQTRHDRYSVRVPKEAVTAVIGQNGQRIKDIERQTGARMHFSDIYVTEESDDETVSADGGGQQEEEDPWRERDTVADLLAAEKRVYRYLSVSGSMESIRAAEELVNEIIAKAMVECEAEKIVIPAGINIIGAYGQTINGIREASGATVKVKGDRYGVRVATIRGDDKQRSRAKDLITDFIKSSQSTSH